MLHIFLNSAPHHVRTAISLIDETEDHKTIYFSKCNEQRKAVVGLTDRTASSRYELCKILLFSHHKHLMFHGLYDTTFIWFFSLLKLKKSISVHFWGADLYISKKRSWKKIYIMASRLFNFRLIDNFLGLDCDFKYFQDRYYINCKFLFQTFPARLNAKYLDEWLRVENTVHSDVLRILVGNSADEENNYLEILPTLENYQKNKEISFTVILGYGGTSSYKSQVMNEYRKRLNNVEFLLTKLTISDYEQVIKSCNIILMGHERQQGVGSLSMGLANNKTIILRKNNPLLEQFKLLGFPVFEMESTDIDDHFVGNLKNKNLVPTDKIRLFSLEGAEDLWSENFSFVSK